ncbi:MAG: 23S rRNA (uracil(1939)-C(5))-methyltransferase RlmD [Candidatus Omnitrophica bacterium]|nr:23S rRNA (uracil(1939)-C(5))-methyltransferase RlmD [Candidatus Omnitrophota bacterium]
MKIILATKSERRKELFKKICNDFEVVESSFNENEISEENPVKYAILCAAGKAKNVAEKYPDAVVIGADTIVVLNNEIIGKPSDYKEAKDILRKLSGTKHSVITGIAIYKKDEEKLVTDCEISYVKFKELSDEQIEKYLEKGEFWDKAGAYGIQDIKDEFVENIEGDFNNVVGLPIEKLKKMLDEFLETSIIVDIYDIAFPNNWGVAKYKDFVVFLPGGIVGDKVKIKISKNLKNYSFGEIVEIVESSPFRVKPICEHFGLCGGCVMQNILYEKQIELKKNYVIQCLKKIAEIEVNLNDIEIIPSTKIYFYRNKMEFAFGGEKKNIILGLRERNIPYKKYTKKVIPLKKCYIFNEKVEKIFSIVCNFFNSTELVPYEPFTQKGDLRHLVIRESKKKNEIMLTFVTKSGVYIDFDRIVNNLTKEIEEVKSIYWVENDQISDVVSYEKKHLIFGKPYIEEVLDNLKFRIYPEVFFQPNTYLCEILYNKIVENINENSKVLGLYCGTGPIEMFVARKAKEVIGVDWDYSNIKTGFENCEVNEIKNCFFYVEKVEKFLNQIKSSSNFSCIIVDPPRGGLSKKCIKKIVQIKIPKIIYVSCNPATLARDLKEFKNGGGYSLKKIYIFDFFPHTSHIESMVILERA